MRMHFLAAVVTSSMLSGPVDAGPQGSGTLVLQPSTDGVLSIDMKRKITVAKGRSQDVVVDAGIHMLSFEDTNGSSLWTRVIRVAPSERMPVISTRRSSTGPLPVTIGELETPGALSLGLQPRAVLDNDRRGKQIVGRYVEEALDLSGVEVDRKHAVGAGDGDQIGD